MKDDFEIVNSSRMLPAQTEGTGMRSENLLAAAAQNFDKILMLASSIVDIEKMKMQSEAIILKMQEDRKMLLAETEAYVRKMNADTASIVEPMKIVREMLRDFYQYNNNANLTGEDFSKIISSVVSEMGRFKK